MQPRAIRYVVPFLLGALAGVGGACGGSDRPAGPESLLAGTWHGDRGTQLVLRYSGGDAITGTILPATEPGAPPASEAALCGSYSPSRRLLVLSSAACGGGQGTYTFQATLTPAGDALAAQWTPVGYGDFILIGERFTKVP